MIINKIRYISFTILLVSSLSSLFALEVKKDSVKAKAVPSLEFSYLKKSDGSKLLICNVGVSINRRVIPVKNVVVNFYTGNDLTVSLGSSVTDYKGKVFCKIPSNMFCL